MQDCRFDFSTRAPDLKSSRDGEIVEFLLFLADACTARRLL
jgi:hypothetical protein